MSSYVVVQFEIYPALDKGMESVRLSPLLSAKDRLAADYLFITESKVMDARNSVPGMMGHQMFGGILRFLQKEEMLDL